LPGNELRFRLVPNDQLTNFVLEKHPGPSGTIGRVPVTGFLQNARADPIPHSALAADQTRWPWASSKNGGLQLPSRSGGVAKPNKGWQTFISRFNEAVLPQCQIKRLPKFSTTAKSAVLLYSFL